MARQKVKSGEFVPLDAEALECGGISAESIDTVMIHEYKPPVIEQTNIDYKGYVIVTEPHGRAIVTKDGLHVAEFMDIDTDLSVLIKQAEEYIDAK